MPVLSGRHFLEGEVKLAERYFSSRKGGNRAVIVETSEHTPFVAPCPLVPSTEIAFKRAVVFRGVPRERHKVQPSKEIIKQQCLLVHGVFLGHETAQPCKTSENFCQTTRRHIRRDGPIHLKFHTSTVP